MRFFESFWRLSPREGARSERIVVCLIGMLPPSPKQQSFCPTPQLLGPKARKNHEKAGKTINFRTVITLRQVMRGGCLDLLNEPLSPSKESKKQLLNST